MTDSNNTIDLNSTDESYDDLFDAEYNKIKSDLIADGKFQEFIKYHYQHIRDYELSH